MKKYINTSNYYLSTTTSKIEANITNKENWHFDVSAVTVDWVTLPLKGYYWVDVDFGDASKREIFRIKERRWYTLYFDQRISPNGEWSHASGASVWLRDFSQLLNSLSTNTDNFWEIEQTWDLSILVRGWDIYTPSNMNAETGKIHLDDVEFDNTYITSNSTLYVIIENDIIAHPDTQWYWFAVVTSELLEESWQYPIAKIITGNTMIDQDNGITDLRANIIGQGNMRKEVYDPHPELHEWSDAFNYDNFYNVPTQETWDISDISDRANKREYWDAKQEELVWIWYGQNIHTINWQSILGPGNFPLDTILTVGWETAPTSDWASTFIFWVDSEHLPLTDDAFLIFTDSGTMLIKDGDAPKDYRYNSETHTVEFNNPLYNDEHAIVWIMYNNSTSQSQIGSADITLKYKTHTKAFNVNAIEPDTIDFETDLGLWDLAHDSTITVKQWWIEDQSFSTNQADDDTINLSWLIPMTQEQYNDEPDTKLTDNNWYFIVEEN